MRRILGIALAVLLIGGVIAVVVLGGNGTEGTATKTVRGVIGSEKSEYFRDPDVIKALAAKGYTVKTETSGSWAMDQLALKEFDFAFPGSSEPAQEIEAAAGVAPAAGLDAEKRRELPFPGSRSVADGLLASYENELRRPSRTVYVLDTSGSMADDNRIGRLRDALTDLTGTGSSGPGQRFRDREEVTLLPFGDEVKKVLTHVVEPGNPGPALDAIRGDVKSLRPEGGTAVYGSLKAAYQHLGQGNADAFTSIVLMTDGESGDRVQDFDSFHAGLPEGQKHTPVFAVLFGDSDRKELSHITELTGGRLFDATKGNGSLDGAFEEIRGYQ